MHTRSAPIRAQIFGINLLSVVLTVLLALGATLFFTLRQEKQVLDRNLMNSAQVVSRVPMVARDLAQGAPTPELWDFLDSATAQVSDIDVIVVADVHSVQYYYPDRAYIGRAYAGSDQSRILDGEGPFTSDDTGVSGAERCAYAPVTAPDGRLLGFVMVGVNLRSLSQGVWRTAGAFLLIAAVAVALGALLSAQLSKRIKGALMGYEPEVFSRLFHQREDILEALEEGVLAIDRDQKIMFVNRAASDMLGLSRSDAVGRPLHAVYPRSTLDRVLKSQKPEYNVPLNSLKHVRVLADRMPIREGGQVVGAVAIFRNRTEVTRLAEDLTGVRHMVEAMRAYTHEFMNKLHVILGLIQLGQTDKAEAYILDVTSIQRQAVGSIMERIQDPSVAALLVGKTSRCAELGIRLTLGPGSGLSAEQAFLPTDAYVTILGNLIENAIDALNQTVRGSKEITVSLREEPERLLLCVEDTGPGLDPEVAAAMFQPGVSTKGPGRGTGLALVREVVEAYQGSIRAESEPGVGTAFFVNFTAAGDGREE